MMIPTFGDQYFWGWRFQELSVGPRPIPSKELAKEILISAIHQAIEDQDMRKQATEIGEHIRIENGVETAVSLIRAFPENGHL